MNVFSQYACVPLLAAAVQAAPTGSEYFESRVRPILSQHCYKCHSQSAEEVEGGLLLDRRGGWLRGGDSGPAVVPGQPGESRLVQAVRRTDPDFSMPPKHALAEEEVARLIHWVRIGAPGPAREAPAEDGMLGDQERLLIESRSHWAFQPVRKPPPPPGEGTAVDRFVASRLAEWGWTLAPPADPRTLLRRLSFDLVGLPPTPSEMEAYLADPDPARAIERLLASPHFGERWGRHWLDVARYADTREWQAAGADSRYPFAYTYRDYVIRSFNEDRPVDRFIQEQIAADQLAETPGAPELAALGFLTVGSRYRNNRHEIINDRIDVVTRGIMGLTVVCARCHDHKYDAIPTTDYYALYGVFNSVRDTTDYPEIDAGEPPDPARRAAYHAALAKEERAMADYKRSLADDAMAEFRKRPAAYLEALHDMSVSKTANVRGLITGKRFKETVLTPIGRNIELLRGRPAWKRDPVIGPLATLLAAPETTFADSLRQVLRQPGTAHPKVIARLKATAPATKKGLMRAYGELFAAALADNEPAFAKHLDEPGGFFHITPEAATGASRLLGPGRTKLAKLEAAINDVNATHPGAPARAMIVSNLPKPVRGVVFERGDSARKGETVDRRFLTLFGGHKLKGGSGRLALARALTGPDNPLTARVFVNRVWMHLLGRPLVESPGDFGLQTPTPEHTELIDWLAADFIEHDWSIKHLIRRITRSRTYQQSSRVHHADDPENRLFGHANVRRLDFEAMRDAMLAVAGNLDPTVGGRAVDITVPPYSTRRTVYALIDRVNLSDVFSTFDFPSPDQSQPRRPETLVPQQALFSMNDGFIIGQARALAKDAALGELDGSAARITRLYERVFQRAPTTEEIRAAQTFLAEAQKTRDIPLTDWSYGRGSADPDFGVEDRFARLPVYDPARKRYLPSRTWPHPTLGHIQITANGGHPGRSEKQGVIRRWRAPYAGTFRIEGELAHRLDKGDGVFAKLLSSRQGLLGEWQALNSTVATDLAAVDLEAGELLDFIVHSGPTANADAFVWAPGIHWSGPAETPPEGGKTVWLADADFAPPGRPPLVPLQQLAHALLMTNEFLFID